MRPVLLPAVLWGQARPRLPWSLTIPAWCSYIRQKNRWSMPKDAIGNISYAPRRGHESCVVTTPAGHVGNKDDKGADREAGTGSEAKLGCLPSVVTPHFTLCVSPMHWVVAFGARSYRICDHVSDCRTRSRSSENATAIIATAID